MNGGLGSALFEPGFFSDGPVHIALIAGGAVALMSGVVGIFTVIRGQSFTGHAFSGVGTTGGSGAFLLGANPVWGYFIVALAAAAVLEFFGVDRRRGRDVATGVVLGAALGLSSLFIYLDATLPSASGITQSILFGSLFTINGAAVPDMMGVCLGIVGMTILLHRPLLLCSVNADLGAAKNGSGRWVSALFLLMLSVAVAMASLTVGAILSTALIVGPSATALRLAKRPGMAMALAGVIGIAAVWLGVLLAYDSASWPGEHAWPASFCIVLLILGFYLLADIRKGAGFQRFLVARANREEKSCLPDS